MNAAAGADLLLRRVQVDRVLRRCQTTLVAANAQRQTRPRDRFTMLASKLVVSRQ